MSNQGMAQKNEQGGLFEFSCSGRVCGLCWLKQVGAGGVPQQETGTQWAAPGVELAFGAGKGGVCFWLAESPKVFQKMLAEASTSCHERTNVHKLASMCSSNIKATEGGGGDPSLVCRVAGRNSQTDVVALEAAQAMAGAQGRAFPSQAVVRVCPEARDAVEGGARGDMVASRRD